MKWPGYQDRRDDGVEYVHIGTVGSPIVSTLTYFAALPFEIRRNQADLVVEDFAAPFSSALVPLWTRRPTIAVVQWLNAREKSRQYLLPFFLVERLGVRLHSHFVVMSHDLADQVKAMNRRALVTVVPNGVYLPVLSTEVTDQDRVVFLGRLEIAQKGVDMLIEAFALVAHRPSVRLVIAGDGPDASRLRSQVEELGIADRVDFVGWVTGAEKTELLANAALVAMPSRFETFGMVAIEAYACATPVLAFDIPCLREVVPPPCGRLVRPFDVTSFGETLAEMLDDPELLNEMGIRGREFVRQFDWDRIAIQQEACYYEAATHLTQSMVIDTTEIPAGAN